MKAVANKALNLKQMFEDLQIPVQGEYIAKDFSHILNFDNHYGKGIVKGYQLSPNLSFVEYNVEFNDNLVFRNYSKEKSIDFIYILEGEVEYANDSSSKKTIGELQYAISPQNKFSSNTTYFKKGVHYKLYSISITNEKVINEDEVNVINHVIDFFNSELNSNGSFYLGSFNFNIIKKFKELEDVSASGIAKILFIKGAIETILGLQIQNFLEEKYEQTNKIENFTTYEVKAAQRLSHNLKDRLAEKLTVPVLSRESGLSPAKLQKLFKIMHDETVSEHITNERLNLAEQLIREKDLTISEISYTVGISSRSYFSKIFKMKHNCTPKFYQENYKKNQNLL